MSSFAWLDFSESDRQKALDVIDLFRERGTVDELGIGTIRDAFADLLFPGTSTIMTRARYFFFVPWVYQRLEKKRIASSEIALTDRKEELALVEALVRAGETLGVIGIEARAKLRRLPSTIYWVGLQRLGIRRFSGVIDSYHRSLDAYYQRGGNVVRGDDRLVIAGGTLSNWDPALPQPPVGWPQAASLTLRQREAEYLRERIIQSHPGSLFAFLVDNPVDLSDVAFPWAHPLHRKMSASNRAELAHARNFSEVMHGAALLYNLMLAELSRNEELVEGYATSLRDWSAVVTDRLSELQAWSRASFWAQLRATGARVTPPTEGFINAWLDRAIGPKSAALRSNEAVRELITRRERQLKGSLARLESRRALDLWGGASGRFQLDYRWNRPVKTILDDMRNAEAES